MKRMRPIVGKNGRMVFNNEGKRMMAPVEVPDLSEVEKRISRAGWKEQKYPMVDLPKKFKYPVYGSTVYTPRIKGSKQAIIEPPFRGEKRVHFEIFDWDNPLHHHPIFAFNVPSLFEEYIPSLEEAKEKFSKLVNLKQYKLEPLNAPWRKKKK